MRKSPTGSRERLSGQTFRTRQRYNKSKEQHKGASDIITRRTV